MQYKTFKISLMFSVLMGKVKGKKKRKAGKELCWQPHQGESEHWAP